MIGALPEKGRADRIAVARGPGSFTGVRVGLAAARALAFAWNAELVGYPTLALIASMARRQAGQVPVTVATTGGHGEWFVERFDAEGASVALLAALAPPNAAALSSDRVIAGSQAEALVALRGTGIAMPLWPDAREFGSLPTGAMTAETLPLYGREPDARISVPMP